VVVALSPAGGRGSLPPLINAIEIEEQTELASE